MGITKRIFKFCSDGICYNANSLQECQKPAFLTTRGGVTLVCAKQVCEQGIEMDGFCVRQGQAMKAPIAHPYTNCVPRLPLYLIWNRYHIQGIEMDGSCLRRVKGLKAPIAHPCTNCVPPAPSPPLYLIWNRSDMYAYLISYIIARIADIYCFAIRQLPFIIDNLKSIILH